MKDPLLFLKQNYTLSRFNGMNLQKLFKSGDIYRPDNLRTDLKTCRVTTSK